MYVYNANFLGNKRFVCSNKACVWKRGFSEQKEISLVDTKENNEQTRVNA